MIFPLTHKKTFIHISGRIISVTQYTHINLNNPHFQNYTSKYIYIYIYIYIYYFITTNSQITSY